MGQHVDRQGGLLKPKRQTEVCRTLTSNTPTFYRENGGRDTGSLTCDLPMIQKPH